MKNNKESTSKMTKNNHYAMAVVTTELWQSGFTNQDYEETKKFIVIRIKPSYDEYRCFTATPKKRFNDADDAMDYAIQLARKYNDEILFNYKGIDDEDRRTTMELARLQPVIDDPDIIANYVKYWNKGYFDY